MTGYQYASKLLVRNMAQRKPTKREGTKIVASKIKMERVDEKEETPTAIVENEIKFLFAPSRYLVFSKFNNTDNIHIREYGVKSNETGQIEYPSKKGVRLSTGRLKVLLNRIPEIDERLKHRYPILPYKTHLGGGEGFMFRSQSSTAWISDGIGSLKERLKSCRQDAESQCH